MADNTTIVDHILKEEGQGRYSVYFKDLTNEDKESIQDWLKDHIEYNDVQKAPALPDDNKAYNTHTENEEIIRDEIKPFNITAFTGDYDDLINAPIIPIVNGTRPTIFNEIAFTGNVNSSNLKVSNVLDFTQYSADLTNTASLTQLENTENNDKFKNIGGSNAYIKGLNQFVKNTDNFIDILSSYLTTFIEDKKPTFFRSNSGIFFITDVDVAWNGPVISYYQVHLVNIVNSNYASAREISGATEAEILENIELTAKNVILIFDLDNNLIYCKTQEINNQSEEETESYEEIDPIFTASPAAEITYANIEEWDNKSDFTGNYADLYNRPFIQYNWGQSREPLFANFNMGYINTNNNYDMTRTIGEVLSEIISNYSAQKQVRIALQNAVVTLLYVITQNDIHYLYFSPIIVNNYSSIDTTITNSNTASDILNNISFSNSYFPCLIYDELQHVLYIKGVIM